MKKIIVFILFFFFKFGYSQTIINNDNKYGVSLDNKQIIPINYDSIRIVNEFILSFKQNKTNVYNLKGEKLKDNIKSYYYFSKEALQIIELSSKMVFINPANETISSKIIKKINKKPISFTSNDEVGNNRITKYIIVGKKKVLKESIHYLKDSVRNSIKNILAPSNSTYVNLINNKDKIEFERGWYNLRYGAVNPDYIIVKSNDKFGIWDLEEEKYILPVEYNIIKSYESYIYIQKDGLATFYPNIGKKPKYKKLEPYTGYFARFETPDGKKGWVDRKGKEYFDE